MERWRPTPIDEIGMPLPLRPPDYPVLFSRPDLFDRNHAWHPSAHPELNDDAGLALKNSRVQFTDWWDHHNSYHTNFDGPPLPTSRMNKFGLTVMAAALYIPDQAIDCRDIEPRIVKLTDSQKQRLWSSGEIRMAGANIVRNFLTTFTLEQDLSHISERSIDEFLFTPNIERRRYLGHWLLAHAADKATEPIDLIYRQAWKLGRIPAELPAKPRSLVQMQFGPVQNRDRIVSKLQHLLAA